MKPARWLVPLTLSSLAACGRQAMGGAPTLAAHDEAVMRAGSAAPGAPGPATATLAADKLVIEAWVTLSAASVAQTVAAIHAEAERARGRIVEEQISGNAADATAATLQLRLPPGETSGFLDWLATRGEVTSRKLRATDVGKQLFDMDLALENLGLTMGRLQKMLGREGLAMADVLAIEKELTRVRGEIERIKGERRWLADRVDFATIEIAVSRMGGPAPFAPRAKLYPGPSLAVLQLVDPNGRAATRVGGGVILHFERAFSLDLVVFPSEDNESRTVITTLGGAAYSDFLGGGRRTFLNPYLGMRLGYGFMGGESHLVVAGEAGVELYQQKYVIVDLSLRALAILFNENDAALQGTLGVQVPF